MESVVEVTKEESVDNTMAEYQPIPPQEFEQKLKAEEEKRKADDEDNF